MEEQSKPTVSCFYTVIAVFWNKFETMAMKLRAYAKINFGLRILGKRRDGYHDIETVFHKIDLFDELEIAPSSTLEFNCGSAKLPRDDSNLCLRAAIALQKYSGVSKGARISLTKRIPIAAGLGGGSSDAATTLKGLSALWNLDLTVHELHQLSTALGSDVPFFLDGASAYATGRGEILQRLDLEIPYWILVATPPLSISTAWAYSKFIENHQPPTGMERFTRAIQNPAEGGMQNDFEPIVFASHPEIKQLKGSLLKAGAVQALLSGSGSSVFGLFERQEDARQASGQFPKQYTCSLTEPSFNPDLIRSEP